MRNFKTLSIALAVAGLMGGTALAGWYGLGTIATSILSVGRGGFALFCLWQMGTILLLAGGWWVVAPEGQRPFSAFAAGRMVRDSAGACLPFSQVGGFLMGARAASLIGLPWTTAIISMVVDLTAEFISELLFAAAGLLVLLSHMADDSMTLPIAGGIVAALGMGLAIFKLHGRALPVLVRFGEKILGGWSKGGLSGVSVSDLAEMYSHTGRLTAATGVHLLGWIAKGIGNWLAFRLLGAHLGLIEALAIEGLLHALLIPAFVIPGYAGVQEAGYAGLGALFGLPPEISIGVSLLRRARDVAIGIPILIVWQLVEMRRLRQA
jgi:putative membrane protein